MAISKNTKKKYNQVNNAYTESSGVVNARNNLAAMANKAPVYQNSYADQLNDIYGRIKNGYQYDPQNDTAFRRYAEEYNALSGLAIAGNQAQAQGLTGGYGSTYAPEVASQGLARLRESVNDAQPAFYQQGLDTIKSQYQAAADARNDELENYGKQADAYNNQYAMAQKRYSDLRDFNYNKFNDSRDFWANQYKFEQDSSNFNAELKQKNTQNEREYKLKSYDVYNSIAANKCADYNDKKNNKGMKAYLDGLVKAGKITRYMADNLYKQYKYTAPARSGGGRGGGRHRSGGGGGNNGGKNGRNGGDPLANWSPDKNNLMYINLRNRGEKYETALNWIDVLVNKGQISSAERDKYAEYYKRKFTR